MARGAPVAFVYSDGYEKIPLSLYGGRRREDGP